MHPSLMPPSLFPQQPQHGQQPNQHNLGLLQNNQGANPGLGMIGGQPGPSNPNYPMNMQQGNGARQQMFMGPQSNGSGLHSRGGGPPHMAGLAPNQMQNMQGMGSNMGGFPGGGMVPQQTVRRVQSQPLNQGGGHLGAMQPGMIGGGMGGMNGPQQIGAMPRMMNPGIQMRPQPQPHAQGGGAMSPEMSLSMARTGQMVGAPLPQAHARAPSASQVMPTMTQPVNLGQGHGMQHNFGNPMSLPHQHQQSQMGSSAHVGPSGQQPPNMGPQAGGNRMVTPDNNMFMNFQNPQIQPPLSHGVPRMSMDGMNNGQFAIPPSSSPMNAGGDMSQRGNALMNPSGPMTPAQALGQLNASGENFPAGSYGMGQPQISAPPRPPSHNGPHNGFPMPSNNPQSAHPTQRSPRQPDHLSNPMHPGVAGMQRPLSQPQLAHRQSPIPPPPVRTPRGSQPSLPMNTGGMPPPQRVPTSTSQSPQGPSHPPAQPPASAPPATHPAQIAPRPPSATATRGGALTPAPSSSTAPPAGQQPNAAAEASQPQRASAPPSAPTAGPSAPVVPAPAAPAAPART